jgi:hypothetical protein
LFPRPADTAQDTLDANPSYNQTCAHSLYAYADYTGSNSYLDMQDSTYFEQAGLSNKWVAS